MKVWHVGACRSPLMVNGVNTSVYALAEEQRKGGDDVCLLLSASPDDAALAFGQQTGTKFVVVPNSLWHYHSAVASLLKLSSPDIVHMHSVFIPQQALLGGLLRKAKIPYVVTPHGGFAPQILARGRLKKSIYSSLVERTRVRGASGISAVAQGEEREIRSYVPTFKGDISCIPNAVNPKSLKDVTWEPDSETPKLVFLGRFDIQHKGIDILVELGRHLPEVELHLFGTEDPETRSELVRLKRRCPPNVCFHEAVFGSEKVRVLTAATLYIQASRWEAFGISIVEAMYIGLPCAVASTLHLAPLFEQHDLGLVFDPDPVRASKVIRKVLRDQQLLKRWSTRAKEFACNKFQPVAVAQGFREFYQRSMTSTPLAFKG